MNSQIVMHSSCIDRSNFRVGYVNRFWSLVVAEPRRSPKLVSFFHGSLGTKTKDPELRSQREKQRRESAPVLGGAKTWAWPIEARPITFHDRLNCHSIFPLSLLTAQS